MRKILKRKPQKTMMNRHLRVKPKRTALSLLHEAQTEDELSSQALYQLALLQRRRNYHLHYLDVVKKQGDKVRQELDSLNKQIGKISKEAKKAVSVRSLDKISKDSYSEDTANKVVVGY